MYTNRTSNLNYPIKRYINHGHVRYTLAARNSYVTYLAGLPKGYITNRLPNIHVAGVYLKIYIDWTYMVYTMLKIDEVHKPAVTIAT